MSFKGQIFNEVVKYLSSKLAENNSFQKLSLRAHERIEGMRRAALNEFQSPDITQTSMRRLLNKFIESGKDFLKKP